MPPAGMDSCNQGSVGGEIFSFGLGDCFLSGRKEIESLPNRESALVRSEVLHARLQPIRRQACWDFVNPNPMI
jgi:hypothetical protein